MSSLKCYFVRVMLASATLTPCWAQTALHARPDDYLGRAKQFFRTFYPRVRF